MVSSYARLAEQFEVIVIERAGGAAEVNLRDRDIVNWRVAELADAPVLIVADMTNEARSPRWWNDYTTFAPGATAG